MVRGFLWFLWLTILSQSHNDWSVMIDQLWLSISSRLKCDWDWIEQPYLEHKFTPKSIN